MTTGSNLKTMNPNFLNNAFESAKRELANGPDWAKGHSSILPLECPRCGDTLSEYGNCESCAADRREEYELPRDVKTGLDGSNCF